VKVKAFFSLERALNNTNANELMRLAAPTKLHITFYSNGKIAKQGQCK
jgi:hypothetical protein